MYLGFRVYQYLGLGLGFRNKVYQYLGFRA
jgi:hypothetical protein